VSHDPFDEHFREPRNTGVLEDPDVSVEVENPVCGDLLRLTATFDEGRESLSAIRFQAYGCPAAVAAGSVLTELVLGKSKADVSSIDRDTVDGALGGLPSSKIHAAVLAHDALRQLCQNW